jgi:hypothetical protein
VFRASPISIASGRKHPHRVDDAPRVCAQDGAKRLDVSCTSALSTVRTRLAIL